MTTERIAEELLTIALQGMNAALDDYRAELITTREALELVADIAADAAEKAATLEGLEAMALRAENARA